MVAVGHCGWRERRRWKISTTLYIQVFVTSPRHYRGSCAPKIIAYKRIAGWAHSETPA